MEVITTTGEKEIKAIEAKTTIAYIIAIEDYRFQENGISSVVYARNDATKFKKLLKDDFGVLEDNIIMWLDKDATKSALEDELRYNISRLTKDDKLIFYYAGHGFYQGTNNRLTCWDSHPTNLHGTTVSINEILFTPLEESGCIQSLVFLDCCAVNLATSITSRDIISNLSSQKLDSFIRPDRYNALFMSCSPGEKSYPSKTLRHGIWTWHLIEALKGNISEVIIQDRYITDASLKNYLSLSIPDYITHHTTHKSTQRPFAKIHSSNDFIIRELPLKDEEGTIFETPKIQLDFSNTSFRKITRSNIKSGKGFKSGHFVPTVLNASSNSFIQRVFEEEVISEVQNIYTRAKNIFSLRSKAISIAAADGAGSVDCSAFRYSVEVEQNPDNAGQALITRKLVVRVKRAELPENFDAIFPTQVNEVIIPIKGELNYEDLVERFENLAEIEGGFLEESPLTEEIDYTTSTGIMMSIDLEEKLLIVIPNKPMKYLQFVDISADELKKISNNPVRLLN